MLLSVVAPANDVARSIPAPAVAKRSSVTPIYPATHAARDLCERLGGYLEIRDEVAYEAVSAASATVEAHFHYLGAVANWLSRHGIATETASQYVAATFSDLNAEMNTRNVDFNALARAHTTTGGLNEQFADRLASKGAFTGVAEGLDAVLERLTAFHKSVG